MDLFFSTQFQMFEFSFSFISGFTKYAIKKIKSGISVKK